MAELQKIGGIAKPEMITPIMFVSILALCGHNTDLSKLALTISHQSRPARHCAERSADHSQILSISKHFAFKTFFAEVLLLLCLLLTPYPGITSDKLLIPIGSVFFGLGTGLTMSAGCALDRI